MNTKKRVIIVFVLTVVMCLCFTSVFAACSKNYDMSEVRFENKSVEYDGQSHALELTGTLPDGLKVSYAYYADAEYKNKVDTAVDVGTYYVVASFTEEEGYNKPEDMKATLTITGKNYNVSSVKFEDKTVDYNGEIQTVTISGTLPQGVDVTYSYYTDSEYKNKVESAVEAGKYYVVASFAGEKGYNKPEDKKAVLTINKIDVKGVSFEDKAVDYNGEQQSHAITGTLPKGVTVKYAYYTDQACTKPAQEVKNVGDYYVKATFDCGVSCNPLNDMTAKFTINKVPFANADITVKGIYTIGEEEKETVARVEKGDTVYVEYVSVEYALRLNTWTADGGDSVKPTIKYFRTRNEDGTLGDPTLTDNTILNLGDVMYVQATFSDGNHIDTVVVKEVVVRKRTYQLSTFEDLQLMRMHIFGGTYKGEEVQPQLRDDRKNVRYILMNDIDCRGQVWTPVQYTVHPRSVASVMADYGFVSEFDGQGYTISNYKITPDSFDIDHIKENQMDAVTRIHMGFFGYVSECSIHDVTFDGVKITIDKTFAEQDFSTPALDADGNPATDTNGNPVVYGTGTVIYYIGIVAGRVDSNKSQSFEKGSDLYNITVKNCDVDVEGYRVYIGGISGIEYIGYTGKNDPWYGRRDNLTVSDCSFYATCISGRSEFAIGGFIGRVAHDGVGPDAVMTYNDCSVKNIKLGYNIEKYLAADEADKAALLPTMGYSVGSFFGNACICNYQFNDCSLENYLLAFHGYSGYAGYFPAIPNTELTGEIVFKLTGCTRTLDPEWNGGVNGFYNENGEHVEENEANKNIFHWGTVVE